MKEVNFFWVNLALILIFFLACHKFIDSKAFSMLLYGAGMFLWGGISALLYVEKRHD